jgi:AcrR family transcriptional regulator
MRGVQRRSDRRMGGAEGTGGAAGQLRAAGGSVKYAAGGTARDALNPDVRDLMANELDARGTVIDEAEPTADRILRATIDALETAGVEALQLAEIAKQARVSLATIYKCFGSRDGLFIAAVERWMDLQTYGPLAALDSPHALKPGDELAAALIQYFARLFEPWQRNPHMLDVFTQVRHGPGGERLRLQGANAVAPALRSMLAGVDDDLREDFYLIVGSVHYGLVSLYSAGEISIGDIMPAVARTISRLLGGCGKAGSR